MLRKEKKIVFVFYSYYRIKNFQFFFVYMRSVCVYTNIYISMSDVEDTRAMGGYIKVCRRKGKGRGKKKERKEKEKR